MLAGTDYDATPLGTNHLTMATRVYYDVTSVVQGWVNGTMPVQGFMYKITSTSDAWVRVYNVEVVA